MAGLSTRRIYRAKLKFDKTHYDIIYSNNKYEFGNPQIPVKPEYNQIKKHLIKWSPGERLGKYEIKVQRIKLEVTRGRPSR